MTCKSETHKIRNRNSTEWEIVQSIDHASPHDWNRCVPSDCPFLRHEFLSALENSGCVSEETGWTPQHIVLRNLAGNDSEVLGVTPLYLKEHSWGEFIFDWEWARGYQRHGLHYYPKSVSQVPFTPLTGPKLLAAPATDGNEIRRQLADAGLSITQDQFLSSLHWLFVPEAEVQVFETAGLIARCSTFEYVWNNQNYNAMDDFLATFSSRKRKKIRHERKSISAQGIKMETIQGVDMTQDHWLAFEQFYISTLSKYGSNRYLSYEFFRMIGETMPENIVLFLASIDQKPVAGSLCLQGGNKLFGRYWGALAELPNLHFETCYYTAIEYCIRMGYEKYNAGVQGEHKLSRGFLPELSYSAHLINEPAFAAAIRNYVKQEARNVRAYLYYLDWASPYSKAGVVQK